MNNLQVLLEKVELMAKEKTDGHFSILKFTTGYKVFLGTPNLDIGEERENVNKIQSFTDLNDALDNLLKTEVSL